jgi:hypothetical protein
MDRSGNMPYPLADEQIDFIVTGGNLKLSIGHPHLDVQTNLQLKRRR